MVCDYSNTISSVDLSPNILSLAILYAFKFGIFTELIYGHIRRE